MKRIIQYIQSFLKALWCGVLNALLPNHTKRTFFITTVYLNMTNLHEFKQETLAKLNEALTLAEDEAALTLPALLYQLGLVGQEQGLSQYSNEVIHHLQPEDEYLRDVCRAVLDVTPKWMQYGRRDDMFKDLFGMFKLLPHPTPNHCY
jgi:hypothetical protein